MINNEPRQANDTTPRARKAVLEMLSQKSPLQKLKMVSRMNSTTRFLALSGLRDRHVGETEVELRVRLAALLYGPALAAEVAKKLKVSWFD